MELTLKEQLEVLRPELVVQNKGVKQEDKIHSNDFKLKEVTMNKINTFKQEQIEIKRGDILYVDLEKGVGSEQFGIRYCVSLQNDVANRFSPTIIVAFITSKLNKAKLPVHVEIQADIVKCGLPKDSVILLEQIRTIDKRRVIKSVGKLNQIIMKKVDMALDISIKDLKPKTPLEKLDKNIRNEINKQLISIRNCEELISTTKTNSLIRLLIKERSDLLYELQIYCEDNNLNYRDFYIRYQKEEEMVAM